MLPLKVIISLLMTITVSISAQSTIYRHDYKPGYDFKILEGKFACLMLNTSSLLGPISLLASKDDSNFTIAESAPRFTYMVMPIDEADLPVNWNYIVTDDQQLIIFYGFALGYQDKTLELEIIRHDSISSKASRCMIKISTEPSLSSATTEPNQQLAVREQEIEFAFHQIELTKFLVEQHATEVDDIFSKSVWPGSRLVEVKKFGKGVGVLVRIRNNSGDSFLIERLAMEIVRATRGGHHQELCKFKRSKAISVEHLFRSKGLYPNWCTFKFRREVSVAF